MAGDTRRKAPDGFAVVRKGPKRFAACIEAPREFQYRAAWRGPKARVLWMLVHDSDDGDTVDAVFATRDKAIDFLEAVQAEEREFANVAGRYETYVARQAVADLQVQNAEMTDLLNHPGMVAMLHVESRRQLLALPAFTILNG